MSEITQETKGEVSQITEEIFEKPVGEANAEEIMQPNKPAEIKPYKLDWNETEVRVKKRFRHFFRRPTADEVLAWRDKLNEGLELGKDGSIPLINENSENDKHNLEFLKKLETKSPEGYGSKTPPTFMLLGALNALYSRTIFIDEGVDLFDEVIVVNEVIGDVDNPAAHIKHHITNPLFDEAKFRKIKNALNSGRYVPQRNGKSKIVSTNPLGKTSFFYQENVVKIEGVVEDFETAKTLVDPLIKNLVVSTLIRELSDLELD